MTDGSELEEDKFVSFSAKQFPPLQLNAARLVPPNTQICTPARSAASWKVDGVVGDPGGWGTLCCIIFCVFSI